MCSREARASTAALLGNLQPEDCLLFKVCFGELSLASWAVMAPGGCESSASLCIVASGFATRVRALLLCVQRSMLQDSTYTPALHLTSYFFSFELAPSLSLNLSSVNFP